MDHPYTAGRLEIVLDHFASARIRNEPGAGRGTTKIVPVNFDELVRVFVRDHGTEP